MQPVQMGTDFGHFKVASSKKTVKAVQVVGDRSHQPKTSCTMHCATQVRLT